MPTKYVDVRGYATYYYYAGKTTLPDVVPDFTRGRKLILIHAAGSNAHAWHYQYEGLGVAHSPIAPDLPGHGRSSGVEGLPSIDDYADFAIAFADALKIDSAVFVGRSMGGAVVMNLAARYPKRVEGLVLMATAAKFNISKERIELWRSVTMGRSGQPFTTDGYSSKTIAEKREVIQEGWGEQIRTDPRTRWGDMVACADVDLRNLLTEIDTPTLVLAGADDQVTPPADAELIKNRIKGARLEVIADAAHNLTTERPAEVNAAVQKFLAELS
ncbi:MAG TPA: alpha/beta fold hydrolase [Candidatus Binataceae bacterium]|jgi:pimeloyl-ACP methyl ester carboxylesterase|nr:alpha/beta fold hydrolase [Candidatus Binataceae bacterium]